ncbi:MAG: two-component regulator propeller domain-containing protein [Anaerolineae bacterium]
MSNKNRAYITLVVIGLLLIQIACQTLTGPRPTQPSPAVLATAAPSPTPPPTAAPPSARPAATNAAEPIPVGEANLTCIGLYGSGVTCIENNEWVTYNKDNAGLGSDLVKDMAVCPDGKLLVLHALGLNLFDGTQWRNYGQGWGYGSAEAVACAAADSFWVAHYEGASHFDGATWRTYSVRETLSTDPEAYGLVNDIAIAPDGAVWVVTVNSIAVFANEQWTVYEEGAGFDDKYFFENIAFDSRGDPWIVSSAGLHQRDGLFWKFYPGHSLYTPQSIVVDAQDRVWVGTFSQGLQLYERGSWLTFTPQNSALASDNVSALAVDAANRLWVGTAWGLHVVDGDTWTSYQMSNSELPDDNIVAIAVAGDGPALPTAQQKAPGALTGRLVAADGTPLANVAIEVCVQTIYSSYSGATPCEGHPYTRDAVSNADGVFTVENLPTGFYNLAVQTGDTWLLYAKTPSRPASERFLVRAGEMTDLGEIIVVSQE